MGEIVNVKFGLVEPIQGWPHYEKPPKFPWGLFWFIIAIALIYLATQLHWDGVTI